MNVHTSLIPQHLHQPIISIYLVKDGSTMVSGFKICILSWLILFYHLFSKQKQKQMLCKRSKIRQSTTTKKRRLTRTKGNNSILKAAILCTVSYKLLASTVYLKVGYKTKPDFFLVLSHKSSRKYTECSCNKNNNIIIKTALHFI